MTHLKFGILVQTLIIPENHHLDPGLKDFLLSVKQIRNLATLRLFFQRGAPVSQSVSKVGWKTPSSRSFMDNLCFSKEKHLCPFLKVVLSVFGSVLLLLTFHHLCADSLSDHWRQIHVSHGHCGVHGGST